MTRWESFKLWFAANRVKIGAVVGGAAVVFRVALSFQGHSEVADFLKSVADLIIAGGAYTAGAGGHKNDAFWKEKKDTAETLPPSKVQTTGVFRMPKIPPPMNRRANDRDRSRDRDR